MDKKPKAAMLFLIVALTMLIGFGAGYFSRGVEISRRAEAAAEADPWREGGPAHRASVLERQEAYDEMVQQIDDMQLTNEEHAEAMAELGPRPVWAGPQPE